MSRYRTSLCREGWYLLLLMLAVLIWALLRENNLLLFVAGVMVGTLLVDWRMSVATLRRVEVRRRTVTGAHAGSWIEVEIEIANGRRRLGTWAVAVEDRIARSSGLPQDKPLHPRLVFPYVPAGQRRQQTYRVCLPQRGGYALGRFCVSTRFPLGLVQRTVWLDGDDQLLVLPRLGQLRQGWLRHCPPVPYGARGARRPGYVPGDFFAIREWQTGDSVRWVHWRSTARHRQLVVRQFEQPGERQLAVLLDLWQPENSTADHARRVELAVSFAATLVADFRGSRGPALLAIAAARPVCLAGRAAGPFSREALASLALAEACPAPPVAALWEDVLRRAGSHGELVVISTRPNVEDAVPELAIATPSVSGQGQSHRTVPVNDDGSALAEYFQWERRSAEDEA
jgi:uncharacterized protein (DUF58 family)